MPYMPLLYSYPSASKLNTEVTYHDLIFEFDGDSRFEFIRVLFNIAVIAERGGSLSLDFLKGFVGI